MIVPEKLASGWMVMCLCNFIWMLSEDPSGTMQSVVTTKICSILNPQPETITVCDSAKQSQNVLEFASLQKYFVIVKIAKGKTNMLWTKVNSKCSGHVAS